MTGETRYDQVVNQITQRAARDSEFRRVLVQQPRETLQEELGVVIPETMQIRVVEETPTTFYLVLLPAPSRPGSELSDVDLHLVAGGWTGWTDCPSWRPACEQKFSELVTGACKEGQKCFG